MKNDLIVKLEGMGFSKYRQNNFHEKRIGDLLWMEIDEYGFMTLRRKVEGKKRFEKVTLPRPIRELSDLEHLKFITR